MFGLGTCCLPILAPEKTTVWKDLCECRRNDRVNKIASAPQLKAKIDFVVDVRCLPNFTLNGSVSDGNREERG